MAYYIFLKSLRRLEEFRKNPHVKIPPRSPSTNFQSLGKFKNLIFIRKEFFLRIQPTRPSWPAHSPGLGLPAGPSHPTPPRPKPPSPLGLSAARPARAFGVFYRRRFPLRFTPSQASRFLPLSLPRGPHLSVSSSPPRRPTPVRIFPAPPLPRATAPHLGCPRAFTTLPHHSPLLIPFKLSVNGP
jgi:hypothetical protein